MRPAELRYGFGVGEQGVVVGKGTAGARNDGLQPNFRNPLVPAPPQTCSTGMLTHVHCRRRHDSNRPHPSEVVRGWHPVRAALHLPHAPPSVPECPVRHLLGLRRCRSQFRPNCSSFLMVADHSFGQESACRTLVGVRGGGTGCCRW